MDSKMFLCKVYCVNYFSKAFFQKSKLLKLTNHKTHIQFQWEQFQWEQFQWEQFQWEQFQWEQFQWEQFQWEQFQWEQFQWEQFQWEQCCWSPFFASASKFDVSLVVAILRTDPRCSSVNWDL